MVDELPTPADLPLAPAAHGMVGRTLLVDWAHAAIGADWIDLVFAAPSVELAGGPRCEELIQGSQRTRRAAAEELTTVVVALLGCAHGSLRRRGCLRSLPAARWRSRRRRATRSV